MMDQNTDPPRIALINAKSHPELLPLIESVQQQRGGTFLNLYAALANSPDICAGWLQLFTAIRQKSTLAPRLRELAMLRVAVLNRAPYEFDAHAPFGRAAGLTDVQLEALRELHINVELFEGLDRAVLAYTDAVTSRIQVSDAEYAPIRAAFSDQTLLELTVTIAGYNMVSRVLEALQIPHESASSDPRFAGNK